MCQSYSYDDESTGDGRILWYVYVKPLLEWVSEYAVRTYPTADSGLTYLIHAQIA